MKNFCKYQNSSASMASGFILVNVSTEKVGASCYVKGDCFYLDSKGDVKGGRESVRIVQAIIGGAGKHCKHDYSCSNISAKPSKADFKNKAYKQW